MAAWRPDDDHYDRLESLGESYEQAGASATEGFYGEWEGPSSLTEGGRASGTPDVSPAFWSPLGAPSVSDWRQTDPVEALRSEFAVLNGLLDEIVRAA